MAQKLTATQQERGWYLADGTYLTAYESAPVEVIRKIHEYAVINSYTFPVSLEIQNQNSKPFYLSLSHTGAVEAAQAPEEPSETKAPVEETTAAVEQTEPAAEENKAAVVESSSTSASAVRAPELVSNEKDRQKSGRKIAVAGGSLAALLLLVGGGLAVATLDKDESAAAPEAEAIVEEEKPLFEIPAAQSPVAMVGERIVTTEDGKLIVTDINSGENKLEEPFEVDEDQLRSQSTQSVTVIDGGKGKVLTLTGDKEERLNGVLNTRGTSPIVVSQDFKKYTQPGSPEKDVPKNSAVLGATEKNVLFVKAPATVEYSEDGRTAAVEAPEKDAQLTAWVSGSEERVVSIWAKDKKTWLVVTSTTDTAKNVLTEEIPDAKAVTYSEGNVIVSDKKYLDHDVLTEICDPGTWVNRQRWCQENSQWKNGQETLDSKPEIITEKYIVSENKVEEK